MADKDDNKKIKKSIYMKKYIDDNKEKLKRQFICEECGGKYMKMSKTHHIKTKKHHNAILFKNLKKENDDIKKNYFRHYKKFEIIYIYYELFTS
jgi:hypothetical protein